MTTETRADRFEEWGRIYPPELPDPRTHHDLIITTWGFTDGPENQPPAPVVSGDPPIPVYSGIQSEKLRRRGQLLVRNVYKPSSLSWQYTSDDGAPRDKTVDYEELDDDLTLWVDTVAFPTVLEEHEKLPHIHYQLGSCVHCLDYYGKTVWLACYQDLETRTVWGWAKA